MSEDLCCPKCGSAVSFAGSFHKLQSGRIREYRVCYHCSRKFSILRGAEKADAPAITKPDPVNIEPAEANDQVVLPVESKDNQYRLF